MSVKSEAIGSIPVNGISTTVFPEHSFLGSTATAMNNVNEVDFLNGVSASSEQQMLLVKGFYKRVVTEINLNVECTVAIVDNALSHVPRSNIVVCAHPLDIPPSVGDTDLV